MSRWSDGFFTGYIISELIGRNNQDQGGNGGDGCVIIIGIIFFVCLAIGAYGIIIKYPMLIWIAFALLFLIYAAYRAPLGLILSVLIILLPGTFVMVPAFMDSSYCPQWLIQMVDKQFGKTIFQCMVAIGLTIEFLYQIVAYFIRKHEKTKMVNAQNLETPDQPK